MEERSIKRSQSAKLTPTEGNKFKFPPDGCSSVDRLRDISNLYNLGFNMRRSFTPIRSSMYMKSPDISPIEFNQNLDYSFKRLPKEKIKKAAADTTVPTANDSLVAVDEDFTLMPPPRRRPAGTGSTNNNLQSSSNTNTKYVVYNKPMRKLSRDAVMHPWCLPRMSPRNEMLNDHISLETLLKDTGMERYIPIFEKEEIDLDIFLHMDDNDLRSIGISANDREIILKFKNMF